VPLKENERFSTVFRTDESVDSTARVSGWNETVLWTAGQCRYQSRSSPVTYACTVCTL